MRQIITLVVVAAALTGLVVGITLVVLFAVT
jgi:hypothetical protein